jgi:hypothetical protein
MLSLRLEKLTGGKRIRNIDRWKYKGEDHFYARINTAPATCRVRVEKGNTDLLPIMWVFDVLRINRFTAT